VFIVDEKLRKAHHVFQTRKEILKSQSKSTLGP